MWTQLCMLDLKFKNLKYQIKLVQFCECLKQVMSRASRSGIGRLSKDQVIKIGKDDIRAISKYLGNKKFIHGDNITLVGVRLVGLHFLSNYTGPCSMQENPRSTNPCGGYSERIVNILQISV